MNKNIPILKNIKITEILDEVFIGEMIFTDRPVISLELLEDLTIFIDYVKSKKNDTGNSFLILMGEEDKGIFNLGGDLKLFLECLEFQDRQRLHNYARISTKTVYDTYISGESNITTIAYLNGRTVGGGFEFALACDIIIADKNIELTFSETKLGFFPGSGAYELLIRKISPKAAKDFILNGEVLTSNQLFEIGLINHLIDPEDKLKTIEKIVKLERKDQSKFNSVRKIIEKTNPLTLDSLYESVDIWSECIFNLSDKNQNKIKRVIRMQENYSPKS